MARSRGRLALGVEIASVFPYGGCRWRRYVGGFDNAAALRRIAASRRWRVHAMTGPKHILVATDGSDCSLKAAAFAGELARSFDARVTILLVQNEQAIIPEAWGMVVIGSTKMPDANELEEARAAFEKKALETDLKQTRSALGDVPGEVDLVQLWGYPQTDICSYAEAHDVDLIVLGSHGRSGIKRVLLGSVSNAVVNTAKCPVTIVR
jgi:nucleotide-binding universal stress UspA family protein